MDGPKSPRLSGGSKRSSLNLASTKNDTQISSTDNPPTKPTTNGTAPTIPTTSSACKPTNKIGSKSSDNAAGATLSPAELKKRAKAEKAARRREKVEGGSTEGQEAAGGQPRREEGAATQHHKEPRGPKEQQKNGGAGAQRRMSTASGGVKPVPFRGKGGQPQHGGANAAQSVTSGLADVRKERERLAKSKQVGMLRHLYGMPRRHTIEGAPKDVHPAVLALGLQMSSYVVCGSNARCVAMLLAFKSVIEVYTTPHQNSLPRHLTTHLSPQIDYLKSCRPLSVSMGNAIRHLKSVIIKIDPAMEDSDAKHLLWDTIDSFIRERITAASTLIAEEASSQIDHDDVILTYAHSSTVRRALLRAKARGKRFQVVVVDSSPLFEGRRFAAALLRADIEVEYCLISAAPHVARNATKCLLGAHAVTDDGRLYSRVGTAVVAMLAHANEAPVLVCAESVKFTERVQMDSFVGNEIAPAEELLGPGTGIGEAVVLGSGGAGGAATASAKGGAGAKGEKGVGKESGGGAGAATSAEPVTLKGRDAIVKKWEGAQGLQMLNLMYDVTPKEYITMIIFEGGSLSPNSAPDVRRNELAV